MLVIAIACFPFFCTGILWFSWRIPAFFGGGLFFLPPRWDLVWLRSCVQYIWEESIGDQSKPQPLQTNLWLLTRCVGSEKHVVLNIQQTGGTSRHFLICHQSCHKWILWKGQLLSNDLLVLWFERQTNEVTQWWSSVAGWHGDDKDSARWTHHWCHRCLSIPPASHYFGRWSCVWKGHQWTSYAGVGRDCGQCKPKNGSASLSAIAVVSFLGW